MLKTLVESVIFSLVENPENVQVNETIGENVSIIEVLVPSHEAGKVIGKDGRIISALRTLAKAAGAKHSKKVTVEIVSK